MTERQLELGAALEDDEDQHCHQHDACRYCEKLGRDPRDPRATEPRPPGNRARTAFLLLEILELLPALRALPQMGFQRDTLRQADVPVEERREALVSILAVHGRRRLPQVFLAGISDMDHSSLPPMLLREPRALPPAVPPARNMMIGVPSGIAVISSPEMPPLSTGLRDTPAGIAPLLVSPPSWVVRSLRADTT
jgi:hypothetical protein